MSSLNKSLLQLVAVLTFVILAIYYFPIPTVSVKPVSKTVDSTFTRVPN